MCKRGLSFLLACLMLLSLTACGGTAPEPTAAATTAPAAQAEVPAATEAPTEPTLSPEEILIASLPEKVRQAYDLGLVELELLEDLNRICLGAEAAQIVQNVHVAHHGVESKIMNQLLESDHAGIEVTRYWLAQTMFAAEAEFIEEAPYDDYLENVKYMTVAIDKDMGFNDLCAYFINFDGANVHFNTESWWMAYRSYEPGAIVASGLSLMPDVEEIFFSEELADEQELYVNCTDINQTPILWPTIAYDRLTGEKIMTANMDVPLLPRQTMTVQEVVETTLRYHNWIPPEHEMYPYAEVPSYDTSVITNELLTKETTLPEASCQELPASWRGIATNILSYPGEEHALTDHMLQEDEIQVIKDAGFNFLRLHLDFRYYASDEYSRYTWKYETDGGSMNESRLKELDQIIAWCMERDIHVNLTCDEKVVGWPQQAYPPAIFGNNRNSEPMAEQWQVFARRYADIPNTYLSFTLYDDPEFNNASAYAKFFTPVVEAIRAVSPDRCIIANITAKNAETDMAALGVALSAQAAYPKNFHFGYATGQGMNANARNALFETATWPYTSGGQTIDAEAVLANCATANRSGKQPAPDTVAAVAQEYGVGFMVFGWAPTSAITPVLQERYNDETMESYLTDFAQVLADRGYGWCYGDANGFVGLFGAYPAVASTTYTQVDTAPLYIDDEMFAWFQTINS